MNQPPELPSLYQLCITLREISPLIGRRLLVCNGTLLTQIYITNRTITSFTLVGHSVDFTLNRLRVLLIGITS
jgi:hypothetical protein